LYSDRYVASLQWQASGEEVAKVGGALNGPGLDVATMVAKVRHAMADALA
jgi:hypothetical protein